MSRYSVGTDCSPGELASHLCIADFSLAWAQTSSTSRVGGLFSSRLSTRSHPADAADASHLHALLCFAAVRSLIYPTASVGVVHQFEPLLAGTILNRDLLSIVCRDLEPRLTLCITEGDRVDCAQDC